MGYIHIYKGPFLHNSSFYSCLSLSSLHNSNEFSLLSPILAGKLMPGRKTHQLAGNFIFSGEKCRFRRVSKYSGFLSSIQIQAYLSKLNQEWPKSDATRFANNTQTETETRKSVRIWRLPCSTFQC
jgi:hypothetical protein